MRKIKFLKDSPNTGHKKGDVDEVNNARAQSWIDQGFAERVDAEKYVTPEAQELIEEGKEKTERNEAKEKNAHAGPGRKK